MVRKNCLVCTVPITDTQLGLDVCRACAAFFKRSQLAGRRYTCRQGSGQCAFRKHEKFTCRSCRYDRCVELGMVYDESVKRFPRKRKEEATREKATSSEEMHNATSSSSMLDRMEAEYNLSYSRRLEQERFLVTKHKLRRIDDPTLELYVSNVTSFYEIFLVTIKEAISLLRHVFDEFDLLSIQHRTTLFKNFLGKFCLIEGVYLISKYFKNEANFVCSLITFVDSRDVGGWVSDEDNIERKDDFRTSLKTFTQDHYNLLIPILKLEKITKREFYALTALAYCDVDQCLDLPEEVISSANKMKAKIFDELQEYYRNELKLVDFSKRLGNLMTIAHGAAEAGNIVNEEMRMYSTMFDVHSEDQLFREIFIE